MGQSNHLGSFRAGFSSVVIGTSTGPKLFANWHCLIRIVQGGFNSADEAEKFIEDFYLARGVIRPRRPEH
jgi:hypothetical protein